MKCHDCPCWQQKFMSGYTHPRLHSQAAHKDTHTHTHSLQVPTASQSLGRKREHFLFQHQTVISNGLTRGMLRWQGERYNCCLSSSSSSSFGWLSEHRETSERSFVPTESSTLFLYHQNIPGEGHTWSLFGGFFATWQKKKGCNWFHLRLIICTGRTRCCKPFIRMHIQHTEQMRRAGCALL